MALAEKFRETLFIILEDVRDLGDLLATQPYNSLCWGLAWQQAGRMYPTI